MRKKIQGGLLKYHSRLGGASLKACPSFFIIDIFFFAYTFIANKKVQRASHLDKMIKKLYDPMI
jgi:hypothetical protein